MANMRASNILKSAFDQGGPSMGMWQMLPGAGMSKLLAQSGADWVLVDCEHGDIDDMQSWMVMRALDAGAHGVCLANRPAQAIGPSAKIEREEQVLVPLLRTVKQAEELVQAAKFPPMGSRGFGSPMCRGSFRPLPTLAEYLRQANDALLTMVQIETKEALEAVDKIAAVEGIDALFIGPLDLGNSIGHPIRNGVAPQELVAAMAKILTACRSAGKKSGIYAMNGEQAKKYAEQGYDMICVATDYTVMEDALEKQMCAAGNGCKLDVPGN